MDLNKPIPGFLLYREPMTMLLLCKKDECIGRIMRAAIKYFFTKNKLQLPEIVEQNVYDAIIENIDRSEKEYRKRQKAGSVNRKKHRAPE